MTILFDAQKVVVAKVVQRVNHKGYVITRNCDPKEIFCHINNGGRLSVTKGHKVTFNRNNELPIPSINDKIAMIREGRENMKYDQGVMWAPIEDWNEVSWVTQLEDVFRVVMFNHMIDGDPAPNNRETITMAGGTLRSIIEKIENGEEDLGRKIIASNLGRKVLSSHVGWDIMRGNKWTNCQCPLPRYLQR